MRFSLTSVSQTLNKVFQIIVEISERLAERKLICGDSLSISLFIK